jgi:hypothetical protein
MSVVAGSLVVAATAGPEAYAEPVRDPAAALELFNRARQMQAAGDWTGACAKFQASMDLNPATGTQIRLARCNEHQGKLARAWADYHAALTLNRSLSGQSEERREELRQVAERELAALEPRVPKLRLVLRDLPREVHLFRGGVPLPETALGEELPVDPGLVEIAVEAPGYVPVRRTVVAAEGEVVAVEIVLQPLPAAPPPAAASAGVATPGPAAPTRLGGRRVAALAVGGAGLAGLGVAAGFGLDTLSKISASSPYCTPSEKCKPLGLTLLAEASRSQAAGFVGLGVGTALVATGIALWVTAPQAARAPPLAVSLGPGGAALRLPW